MKNNALLDESFLSAADHAQIGTLNVEAKFCAFIVTLLDRYGQDVLDAGSTSVALKASYGLAIVDGAFDLFEALVLEEPEKKEN